MLLVQVPHCEEQGFGESDEHKEIEKVIDGRIHLKKRPVFDNSI